MRKVQAGGRRRPPRRSRSINRLVPLPVGSLVPSPDVRGKRHMAGPLHRRHDVRNTEKAKLTQTIGSATDDLGLQILSLELQPLPGANLSSRTHQNLPQIAIQTAN